MDRLYSVLRTPACDCEVEGQCDPCVTACLRAECGPFTLVHGPITRRGTTGYRRPVQNSEVFISAPGRVELAQL